MNEKYGISGHELAEAWLGLRATDRARVREGAELWFSQKITGDQLAAPYSPGRDYFGPILLASKSLKDQADATFIGDLARYYAAFRSLREAREAGYGPNPGS